MGYCGNNKRPEDRRRAARDEMRRRGASEFRFERQAFAEPHPAGPTTAVLPDQDPRYCAWAAEIGGRVVGLIGLVPVGKNAARIAWFRIEPDWQHTSVLAKLIEPLYEHCRTQGYGRLVLDMRLAPQWMWRMLVRRGFRLLRRIRGPQSEVLEFGLEPPREMPADR